MKDSIEFLKDIICKFLNADNAEKFLAYDIFINRIVQSLKYEETIRIPSLGYFQLKKGHLVDKQYLNSDILVFVPLNKLFDELDFAYLNIIVKEKEKFSESLENNIFSLSVNKPLISGSKHLFNNKNETISASLFTVQKEIEDKVNELIKKSDFLEGLNLWEDFLINDKESFGGNEDLFVNVSEEIVNAPDLIGLDLSFTENQTNLDLNNVNKEKETEDNILDELSINDTDLFNESDFNKSDKIDLGLNSDDFDINLVSNNSDEFIENLNKINSDEVSFDSIQLTDLENKENLQKNTTNEKVTVKKNDVTSNQETDWTKELEEELFSDISEEINLSDIEEVINPNTSVNNKEDDTIFDAQLKDDDFNVSTNEDLNYTTNNNESTQELLTNNLEVNNNLSKEESNYNKTDNIDELFDQLLDNNEKKEKPKQAKKFNIKKIVIYLLAGLLILTILGVAYYFLFYKGKEKVKTESKKENVQNVEKNISVEKNKQETQSLEVKKDSLQNTPLDTNLNKQKETEKINNEQSSEIKKPEVTEKEKNKNLPEPKQVETKKNNESITKVENKTSSIPLNSDLYRELTNDKQIAEKIYFDGKKYHVQTSSWRTRAQAEAVAKKLRAKGIPAYIVVADLKNLGGTWYRIKIFNFNSKAEAEEYIKKNKL